MYSAVGSVVAYKGVVPTRLMSLIQYTNKYPDSAS